MVSFVSKSIKIWLLRWQSDIKVFKAVIGLKLWVLLKLWNLLMYDIDEDRKLKFWKFLLWKLAFYFFIPVCSEIECIISRRLSRVYSWICSRDIIFKIGKMFKIFVCWTTWQLPSWNRLNNRSKGFRVALEKPFFVMIDRDSFKIISI